VSAANVSPWRSTVRGIREKSTQHTRHYTAYQFPAYTTKEAKRRTLRKLSPPAVPQHLERAGNKKSLLTDTISKYSNDLKNIDYIPK
jgi:hypothetical protein